MSSACLNETHAIFDVVEVAENKEQSFSLLSGEHEQWHGPRVKQEYSSCSKMQVSMSGNLPPPERLGQPGPKELEALVGD